MSENTPDQHPVFHHVNIKTTRLQEMIDWYGTVLGMKVIYQFPGGAFLSHDEANHRIAFLAFPGFIDDPDRVTHTGMHHIAFEYTSVDMLIDVYLRLKELQIEPHLVINHGITTSFRPLHLLSLLGDVSP
jgi:catechol 2,3-dioxygenase-like lactoylglutathione lyase family enzyme